MSERAVAKGEIKIELLLEKHNIWYILDNENPEIFF